MDRPGPLAQAMITYIIPAHNEELLIGRTISALHTAAGAVNEAYEIIVVDDASTVSSVAPPCKAAVYGKLLKLRDTDGLPKQFQKA